jgi:hypothetical protein
MQLEKNQLEQGSFSCSPLLIAMFRQGGLLRPFLFISGLDVLYQGAVFQRWSLDP